MNLIFDFDGTLCDSLDTTIHIANKYFKLFHIPPTSDAEYRRLGVRGLLANRKIPLSLAFLIAPISHWEYRQRLSSLSLFNWAENTIKTLGKSHTLGVLTNNSTSVVRSLLSRHHLDHQFKFIVSESGFFNKHSSLHKIIASYRLDPATTYYIGDALRDIEAAHKIGIKSVGVTWGHESDALLASAQPTLLISHPSHLLEL